MYYLDKVVRVSLNDGKEVEPVDITRLEERGSKPISLSAACDGKHYILLTEAGEVWSWGLGDGGRLGHGGQDSAASPRLIQALAGRTVIKVATGSTYSAALTAEGELFTWGKGNYGRLGHGNVDDCLVPTLVSALAGHRVVDVACGSGDAQTLAVTSEGLVYSWGDGDYGKLGRGGSDGSGIPRLVDRLSEVGVVRVFCGSQCSVALDGDGKVYTWGKGDNFRLGHGTEEHVRFPRRVEGGGLNEAVVVDVSVGLMHTVAVTREGKLYGWGKNDQSQLGGRLANSVAAPTLLASNLSTSAVGGLVCGPANTVAWTSMDAWSVPLRAPFVVDISEQTFRWIDSLLTEIWEGLDGRSGGGGLPPRQEEECLACAALNLLKLQMLAVRHHSVSLDAVNMAQGTGLLASIKKKVVELASNSGVLDTIQQAAQQVLEAAWMILLPTADERARALSTLLPGQNCSAAEASGVGGHSTGRKFMTDLLVSSLMADGGLKTALKGAIRMEIKELEEVAEKEVSEAAKDKPFGEDLMTEQAQLESETKRAAEASTSWEDRSAAIPLLFLVRQLLRNSSAQALARVQTLQVEIDRCISCVR